MTSTGRGGLGSQSKLTKFDKNHPNLQQILSGSRFWGFKLRGKVVLESLGGFFEFVFRRVYGQFV